MIDSHCHLADRKFSSDLDAVIARAHDAGIETMVTISDNLKEGEECQKIAEKYDHIFYTIGVHPHEAKTFDRDRDLPVMRRHTQHPKCKAIGEIGLDYHYMNSEKADQQSAFRDQLSLAKELDLPVVVHTREAIDDTWEILCEIDPAMIVLHCCTEKWDDVKQFVDKGYLLSFTGIATYEKPAHIRETIRHCPLSHMMVETDAPYLAPQSTRGKRNESAFVVEVAQLIARIKNVPLEEVDRVTTENARKFYGI